jgi:hypothetical protein
MPRLFAPKPPAEKKEEPAPQQVSSPPQALSKDDVKTLVSEAVAGVSTQLAQTIQQLSAKVEELATRQPSVVVQSPATMPAMPEPADITDQEIDAAVLQGQGAAARIRALVDRAVNAATSRIIEQHVKPLQEYGVNTLSELSRRVTAGRMKYYDRFKKEIDERLNALSPDVRANPVVIETIYNAVVGAHADELAREAAEAAVRQAQDASQQTGKSEPGTGAGREALEKDSDVPSIDKYLGPLLGDGLEALQHKGPGVDPDAFARGLGYKDWAHYMKSYQELLAAESQGRA